MFQLLSFIYGNHIIISSLGVWLAGS